MNVAFFAEKSDRANQFIDEVNNSDRGDIDLLLTAEWPEQVTHSATAPSGALLLIRRSQFNSVQNLLRSHDPTATMRPPADSCVAHLEHMQARCQVGQVQLLLLLKLQGRGTTSRVHHVHFTSGSRT